MRPSGGCRCGQLTNLYLGTSFGFLSLVKCLSLSVRRLLCSFQLQRNYSKFRNNLEKALRGEPTCALYHRAMDHAVEVLRAEKEKGDPDILDDAVQDENIADPVDAAIKVLIGDVVANHGFSPVTYHQFCLNVSPYVCQ